mmetsp:Transcript_113208/g.365802  ORF Transcript_113208/g.365802 Transcript_113208/m.365802 type:complete len:294 (+) Transcript_113208:95-976(+)
MAVMAVMTARASRAVMAAFMCTCMSSQRGWPLALGREDADALVVILRLVAEVQERLCDMLPVDLEGQLCLLVDSHKLVTLPVRGVVFEVALLVLEDGCAGNRDVQVTPVLEDVVFCCLHVSEHALQGDLQAQPRCHSPPRLAALSKAVAKRNRGHAEELRRALHALHCRHDGLYAWADDPLRRLHHAQEAHDHVGAGEELRELVRIADRALHHGNLRLLVLLWEELFQQSLGLARRPRQQPHPVPAHQRGLHGPLPGLASAAYDRDRAAHGSLPRRMARRSPGGATLHLSSWP